MLKKTSLLLAFTLGAGVVSAAPQADMQRRGPSPLSQPQRPPQPEEPPPTASQLADARQLSNTFSRVASQVGPSVVRISVTKEGVAAANPFEGTPFEDFFGMPPGGNGAPRIQQGTGSGVALTESGYILTNNHVVEGADEVTVALENGESATAKVVGTDPRTDLAVIKVDDLKLAPAKLGRSDDMKVGEWVLAIGNPFGLDHTVTVGVLSAKNRAVLGGGRYEDFLQTDASINPGNSGGPLVNLNGEVIGINTMIAGIGTGIGFAVPTSIAEPIAEQLIKTGKVVRAYVGIGMQDLTREIRESLGGNAPKDGALVGQVQVGSPAAKAGLQPGDIIISVGGTPVEDGREVQRMVLRKQVGDKVRFTVWRDGKTREVTVTTAQLPDEPRENGSRASTNDAPETGKLGLALQTLDSSLAQRLEVPAGTKGAAVVRVAPGSPADRAGLEEGDVIAQVDNKAVGSAQDAVRALKGERKGGHLVRVVRKDTAMFVVLKNGN